MYLISKKNFDGFFGGVKSDLLITKILLGKQTLLGCKKVIINILLIIYKWCIVEDAGEQGEPVSATKIYTDFMFIPSNG